MRQLFQPLEPQKSSGSLDRMHGSKDVRQQGSIVGPLLQFGESPLHAVQPLLALDQELSRQFVHFPLFRLTRVDPLRTAGPYSLYRNRAKQLEEGRELRQLGNRRGIPWRTGGHASANSLTPLNC